MHAFWTNTPYWFWGIYIGGDEMGCSQPNLSSTWVADATDGADGNWELTQYWVGPQAPYSYCTGYANTFPYENNSADYSDGGTQAADAYYEVVSVLGMGSNTPITYDLEAYSYGNGNCVAAAQNFVNGWTHQLALPPAQDSGVYGSVCGSDLTAYAAISRPPTYIHGAYYDGNSSTSDMACVPSGDWSYNQRLKQFEG
jgi:hypothetical protein